MGTDLREHSARARDLFALADTICGQAISRLCAEGPLADLTDTVVAQPAVVVTSLAAWVVLQEHIDLHADAVAGHSVGELSAYVAADVFDAGAALRLVRVRAVAMAEACATVDGSMTAVIGLDENALLAACREVSVDDSLVQLANLNAPGQLVVSGARDAIDRIDASARARGARRLLPLNVGGPFHSSYMRPAAEALARALDETPFRAAQVPVVLNSTAEVARQPADLRRELAVQVYSPVRWVETVQRLAELGCDRFLEVGPGRVLSGLVRRTLPEAQVASFGSLADLPGIESLLQVAVR